jgi:hypothetical protein
MTPTQRTLKVLRDAGWLPWVVERYAGGVRIDLYNCMDLIALKGSTTMVVQCTSTGVSERVAKVLGSPYLPAMLEAGWLVVVMGWRKNAKGRYTMRVVQITETVTELEGLPGGQESVDECGTGCAPRHNESP